MAMEPAALRSPNSLIASRSPFAVPPVAGSRAEHRGLNYWMNRVLEELADLHTSSDPDTVHDLRVAIRRCRSLATAMQEVDPDPAWHKMRKFARKLFRSLGSLRDAHVMEDWIKKLGPENDSLGSQFLASLEADEKQFSESALRVAAKFDRKEWSRLERHLRRRARLVPVGGLAAECLALERFEEAKELHSHALRSEKPKLWHALRIGLKRFRYTVEGLLPDHYAVWSDSLKRLQDLLGDVHDLDVLSGMLKEAAKSEAPETSDCAKSWKEKISRERHERIETYRQLTLGKTSLWHGWRHNLPHGRRLEAATLARISATARAADAHSRRAGQVSRLATRLFDLLARANAAPLFHEPAVRRVLEATAKLHGIEAAGDHRLSPRALRKFLLGLPVPPNWTAEEWNLMAWAVRFHRGPEPRQKNGFAKLSEEEQIVVRALAGLLRLARGLRKTGVERTAGLRFEKSPGAMILSVPDLVDTEESAARLAAAKHLLESVLEKPLILKPVPKLETQATPAEPQSEPPLIAAASD